MGALRAILLSNTLGTASGDWLSDDVGVGFGAVTLDTAPHRAGAAAPAWRGTGLVMALAAVEALLVGVSGAESASRRPYWCERGRAVAVAPGWTVAAALVGLALAVLAVRVPAWRDHCGACVMTTRRIPDAGGRPRAPWWTR